MHEPSTNTSHFEIDTETDETVVVTDTNGNTYRFARSGPVASFEAWTQHGETYRWPDVPDEVIKFLKGTGYRVVELE